MSVPYPHAIPTPPFSPNTHPTPSGPVDAENSTLKETVNLLDSLIAYYQQERMWVYRTRATLENAFGEEPVSDSQSRSQTARKESVKDEHDDESLLDQSDGRAAPPGSRWIKRKKGFKMRLELSPKRRRAIQSSHTSSAQPSANHPPPREQLLTMFEKMMEARMESCVRINNLIKNANRAHLHER